MSALAAVVIVLLAVVAAGSLALLAVVVRLSVRRSETATVASEAMQAAIRRSSIELIRALVTESTHEQVEAAALDLARLLDVDPLSLRQAGARSAR